MCRDVCHRRDSAIVAETANDHEPGRVCPTTADI